MIIAIDIGGTKTLVAACTNSGQVLNKQKYPSPKNYQQFVIKLVATIKQNCSKDEHINTIAIGCAGVLNRTTGTVVNSPNLNWHNKPLVHDLMVAFKTSTVIIENDANLAGLSEAHSLNNINQRVMYITFSTGIGTGFVINGVLEPSLIASEGGRMVFEHDGQMVNWESFSSGSAIVKQYKQMASEINDPQIWQAIVRNMAPGIVNNCAVFMADTVIIGGSVGTYFDKYADLLRQEVARLTKISGVIQTPKIIGAKNAEECVMLGCIILARQK